MDNRTRRIFYALFGLILLVGCMPSAATPSSPATELPPAASPAPQELKVMTHDSFAVSEGVLTTFEQEHNARVQILKSGDAGTALNKAILAKDNPLADVFYGVDNTFLSRALDEGIFETYESALLKNIPERFQLDPKHGALPVDYGDVCLNYDKAFLKGRNLAPPESLDDLTDPAYKSLLVVENPAGSSPGLAFLLTTIANYGEDGYLNYWKKLVENDVLVVDSWETAYYTEFSGSSGKGPRPIIVSYNSSPVFEVIYAETKLTEPPTAAVVSPKTCFRQIEFAGILKGAKNHDLAAKWIDFMLSPTFQEDMPLQMYVFPVNQEAKLGQNFTEFLQIPDETAEVSPQSIAQNREKWLNEWTEAVLR